jgi:hypothetical protein
LVTENGSLTPICSLSPNLTVLLKIIFSVPKNKLSEINKTYIDIGNGQQGSNWLPKSGLAISNAAQRRAAPLPGGSSVLPKIGVLKKPNSA